MAPRAQKQLCEPRYKLLRPAALRLAELQEIEEFLQIRRDLAEATGFEARELADVDACSLRHILEYQPKRLTPGAQGDSQVERFGRRLAVTEHVA